MKHNWFHWISAAVCLLNTVNPSSWMFTNSISAHIHEINLHPILTRCIPLKPASSCVSFWEVQSLSKQHKAPTSPWTSSDLGQTEHHTHNHCGKRETSLQTRPNHIPLFFISALSGRKHELWRVKSWLNIWKC